MSRRPWFVSIGWGAVVAVFGVAGSAGAQSPYSPHFDAVWEGGTGFWSNAAGWSTEAVPNNIIAYWDVRVDDGSIWPSLLTLDLSVEIASVTIDSGDMLWIDNGQILTIRDDRPTQLLMNSGVVVVNGVDRETRIELAGWEPSVFDGGGTLHLGNSTLSGISGAEGTETLMNMDHTIQGAGQVGLDSLAIVNHGLINANFGLESLTIDANGVGLTNSGELRASDGGKLVLRDSVIDNGNGIISTDGKSIVELWNSSIAGGTLQSEPGGTFVSAIGPVRFDRVRLEGTLEIISTSLVIDSDFVNDGSVSLSISDNNAGGEFGRLVLPETPGVSVNVSGNGTMDLAPGFIQTDGAPGARLINAAGHTISGAGEIGSNTLAITNYGTIVADTQNLLILNPPPGESVINHGVVRALGADPGGIVLSDGEYENYGVIEVLDGSRLVLPAGALMTNASGGVLDGGTWRVLSEGHSTLLWITGNTLTINNADVTLRGPAASFPQIDDISFNQGSLNLEGGRDFTTNGFFNNSGTLAAGPDSLVQVPGDFTQTAGATLRLGVGADGAGRILASGSATIGGTLEIVSEDSPVAISGMTFSLLSAEGMSGEFSEIIAPSWIDVTVTSSGVTGSVVNTCNGDFDYSGVVDAADMLVLISSWGQCPPATADCRADINGDGNVDAFDQIIMLGNWGPCPF